MEHRIGSNFTPRSVHYDGVQYCSIAERNWAVFMDVLGIRHRYEPETFDLPGWGRYTPDFHLIDLNVWLEVKPDKEDIRAVERFKPDVFARHSDGRVWLSRGDPGPRRGYIEQIANDHGGAFAFGCLALDNHYPRDGVWLLGCDATGFELLPQHIPAQTRQNTLASWHVEPANDLRIQMAFSNAKAGGPVNMTPIGALIARLRSNHRIRTGQKDGIAFSDFD